MPTPISQPPPVHLWFLNRKVLLFVVIWYYTCIWYIHWKELDITLIKNYSPPSLSEQIATNNFMCLCVVLIISPSSKTNFANAVEISKKKEKASIKNYQVLLRHFLFNGWRSKNEIIGLKNIDHQELEVNLLPVLIINQCHSFFIVRAKKFL